MYIPYVAIKVAPLEAPLGTVWALKARLLATMQSLVSIKPLFPHVTLATVWTGIGG